MTNLCDDNVICHQVASCAIITKDDPCQCTSFPFIHSYGCKSEPQMNWAELNWYDLKHLVELKSVLLAVSSAQNNRHKVDQQNNKYEKFCIEISGMMSRILAWCYIDVVSHSDDCTAFEF